jgi:hypothetical protein
MTKRRRQKIIPVCGQRRTTKKIKKMREDHINLGSQGQGHQGTNVVMTGIRTEIGESDDFSFIIFY